jgi:hypothetical protein
LSSSLPSHKSARSVHSESKHQVENKTNKKATKTEIRMDHPNQLGPKLIIEIRDVENPKGRAFVVQNDLTKNRSKNKTKKSERKIFVSRMSANEAEMYCASNNKQRVVAIEKKFVAQYAEVLNVREHRLALSILKASGIPNAAVALLCHKRDATQLCQQFRTRENESVIGLLPVLYHASSNAERKEGTRGKTAKTVETAGVGQQQVTEAWDQRPLTGNESGIKLQFGHHLLRMLQCLSTSVPVLQRSGKLSIPTECLCLVLIVQRRNGNKSVKIDCPGGKRHFGEHAQACAVREVNEEVGFQLLSPSAQQFLCSFSMDETMEGFVAEVKM